MTDTTTQELVETCRRMAAAHDKNGEPRTAATLRAAASRLSEMEAENKRLREAAYSALKRLEKGAPGWGVAKDELRAALNHQQKGEGL